MNSQQKFDAVSAQLTDFGGRVKGWTLNPETIATSDEILESKTKFLQAFIDGNYRRIFMIDSEDENGWLHALEDAWNMADKAGENKLADKLEEIIKFHMDDCGKFVDMK